MKNIYQIRTVRNGIERVSHQHMEGDLDELHIVSMRVKRRELEKEVAAIVRANRFHNVLLPWLVVGTFTVFFAYNIAHSWKLI